MNKVKELREEAGLSQRELSERVHVCQSLICAVERGRTLAYPKLRREIALALRVRQDEVFPDQSLRVDG